MLQQFVRGVLGVVLATAMAIAQASMNVTSGTLTAGQTVQINYCDGSRANSLVVIQVDDGGFPFPMTYEVAIYLDAKGRGTANWVVPECEVLHFNGPGVREVSRVVL